MEVPSSAARIRTSRKRSASIFRVILVFIDRHQFTCSTTLRAALVYVLSCQAASETAHCCAAGRTKSGFDRETPWAAPQSAPEVIVPRSPFASGPEFGQAPHLRRKRGMANETMVCHLQIAG